MKRLKQLLYVIAIIWCSPVFAYDFMVDGVYYNITSLQELTVEVTSGDIKYEGNVIIPETVDYSNRTFKVTRVGEMAFLSCPVTSIELPHSIVTVGKYAFRYSNLRSITIPNSIVSFEMGAFGGCYSLNNVIIEDDESSISMYYNEWQVNNSSYFNNCNLQSVYYGRNVSYRTGEEYDGLFWNQRNLKNVVIGNLVTIIGTNLFKQCSNLEEIDIPSNVLYIYNSAFEGCSSLKDIYLHDGLQSISSKAFKNCKSIEQITLPSTITSIGSEAFSGCTSIMKICSKIMNPSNISASTFAGIVYLNSVLFVPTGTKSLYEAATGWKDFAHIEETDDFDETPSFYRINLFVTGCGNVSICDATISNSSFITQIMEGDNLTLSVNPDEGYMLESITVNENEMVSSVIDGTYTLENIQQDYDIHINFIECPPIVGDVDGDGIVNISDVTALIDYILVGSEDISFENADVSGNGKVNISDVTDLIDLILGN